MGDIHHIHSKEQGSANEKAILAYPLDYQVEVESEYTDSRLRRAGTFVIETFKRKKENEAPKTGLRIVYSDDEQVLESEVLLDSEEVIIEDDRPWFADYGQFARRKELQAMSRDRDLSEAEQGELKRLDKLIHHEKLAVLGGIAFSIVAVSAKLIWDKNRM